MQNQKPINKSTRKPAPEAHSPMAKENRNGFAAFLIIVIVAAVTLIMAFSASFLGLGELEMGYNLQKGAQTMSVADACLDEAVLRLKRDSGYTGETLNLDSSSCIIQVTGGGNNRTVTITATSDTYTKKIQADLVLGGTVINITAWQEI